MIIDETLIIFTTDYIYVDKEVDNTRLWNKERAISPPNNELYQLDKLLVFAHKPLSRGNNTLPFIEKLLEKVVKQLSEEDKTKIKHIKLILHRYELGILDEVFFDFLYDNQSVFKEVKKYFSNSKLLTKNDKKIEEDKIDVELIGYRHEPDNIVYDCLMRVNKKTKEHLNNFLESFENLKKIFVDETKEIYLGDEIKKYLNKHTNFNFTYCNIFWDENKWNWSEEEEINPGKKIPQIKVITIDTRHLQAAINPNFLEVIVDNFFFKDKAPQNIPLLIIVKGDIKKNEDLLDTRYRFLDSSIWCRMVSYEDVATLETDLKEVLKTIKQAYDFDLYNKNVCKEYIEFQIRMLKNSYLNNFGGGHASAVTPFMFHSESIMETNAAAIQMELSAKNIKWNFLLVDDFANLALKHKSNEVSACDCENNKNENCSCKKNIIRHWLNYSNSFENTSLINELKCVENIEEAKDVFDEDTTIYDIILLDYLFSQGQKNEYGDELLEKISKGTITKGKSILQNYWIFPISAFPEAMASSLLEKKIQHIEKDWQLVRGADPINTPHLFRNNLLEFMRTQFDKAYFDTAVICDFLEKYPLEKRDNSKEDEAKLYTEWAMMLFRKYIERFSTIEGLSQQSALGYSVQEYFQKDENIDVKILMQRIRQLLFLLVYPINNLALIRNEFNQIQRILKNKLETKRFNKINQSILKDLLTVIEKINHKID